MLPENAPTLFLLAHPDDDIFIRPLLMRAQRTGGAVVVYLTREPAPGATRRKTEACRALAEIGIGNDNVVFLGEIADVPDSQAILRLEDLFLALQRTPVIDNTAAIVTHAFEGGHPDHDAAHIIAIKLASSRGFLHHSYSVPFYRRSQNPFLPFIAQYPVSGTPGFRREVITLWEAVSMILGIRHYRSQFKTFLGLGPWLAMRAIFDRALFVQALSESNAPKRPMPGPLLIETRFDMPFATIEKAAQIFLKPSM